MRLIICLLMLLIGVSAYAQDSKLLSEHKSWLLYRYSDSLGDTCTLSSVPTESTGKYTRRGEVFFHVTARASRDWQHNISIAMGYPIKAASEISVAIDKSKKYSFYVDASQPEFAFLNDKQAKAFTKHMRAGTSMVVKGVSRRGTKTTDNFSLSGVTAGLKSMKQKCQ